MQNAVTINLPKRNIRISSSGIRTVVPPNANGIGAFVAAIAQRYTASSAILRQASMLLRSPVGLTLQPTYQTNQLNWSPHLKLTVLADPSPNLVQEKSNILPTTFQSASRQQRGQAVRLPLQIQPQTHRSIERHTDVLATEHLTRQLTTRWQRMDAISSQHAPSQSSPAARLPPAPRIVRHRGLTNISTDISATPPRDRSSPPANWESQIGPNRSVTKTPEVNINQITDQVVQAIDRRLIAYRERMGRL